MRTCQAYKFTDEELENLKNGKCWCGKDRSEFQKGMKVYCSLFNSLFIQFIF